MSGRFEDYIINASKNGPLDYSHFRTTGASRYSSLMPWHIPDVQAAFLENIPDAEYILDMTAHIGVDMVNFSILYPYANITGIEIKEETCNVLQYNLDTYTQILGRVQGQFRAYCMDSYNLIANNEVEGYDFIYLDPEWGGPEYKNQKYVTLMLGNKTISSILEELYYARSKYVVLKAPTNMKFGTIPTRLWSFKKYDVKTGPRGKVSYNLYFLKPK